MAADWHDVLSTLPGEAFRAWQPAETLTLARGPYGEVAGTSARDRSPVLIRLRALVPGEPPGLLAAAAARARRVRTVASPYLASVHDVVESQVGLALVVERPSGLPFDRFLAEGRLELPAALSVLGQAAAAVAALHAASLVHGTLDPDAVRVDDGGNARLHGAAHLPGPRPAVPAARWCSPERATGLPAQPSDDVFALGRLLEALLATVPALPRPTAAYRAVAARAVADPRRRPPDAREFLRLLAEAEANLEADPAPTPTPVAPVHGRGPDVPAPRPHRVDPLDDTVRASPYPARPVPGEATPAPRPTAAATAPPAPGPSPRPAISPPRPVVRAAPPRPTPPAAVPAPEPRWRTLGDPAPPGTPEVVLDALPGRAPAFDELTASLRRAVLGRRTTASVLLGEVLNGGHRVRIWSALPPEEVPGTTEAWDLLRTRVAEAGRLAAVPRPDGRPLEAVGYAVLAGDPAVPPPWPTAVGVPLVLLLHAGSGTGARAFAALAPAERPGESPVALGGLRVSTLGEPGSDETWLPLHPPMRRVRLVQGGGAASAPARITRRSVAPAGRPRALPPSLLLLGLAALLVLLASLYASGRPRPIPPEEFARLVRVSDGPPAWRRPPGPNPGGADVLFTIGFDEAHDPRRWPPSGYALRVDRPDRTATELAAQQVSPGVWGFPVDGRDPLWEPGTGPATVTLQHLGNPLPWTRVLPYPSAARPTPMVQASAEPGPAAPAGDRSRPLSLAGVAGPSAPLLISLSSRGTAFGERALMRAATAGTVPFEVVLDHRACDGGEVEVRPGLQDVTAAVVEAAARCGSLLKAGGGAATLLAGGPSGPRTQLVVADDWFDPAVPAEAVRDGADLRTPVRLRGAFLARTLGAAVAGVQITAGAVALPRRGFIDQDVTEAIEGLLRDAAAAGVDLDGPAVVPVVLSAGTARRRIDLVRHDLADPARLLTEGPWRLLCVSARSPTAGKGGTPVQVFVDGWGKATAASQCASPADFRRVLPSRVKVGVALVGQPVHRTEVPVGLRRAVAFDCDVPPSGPADCLTREVSTTGPAWEERIAAEMRREG